MSTKVVTNDPIERLTVKVLMEYLKTVDPDSQVVTCTYDNYTNENPEVTILKTYPKGSSKVIIGSYL